MLHASMLYSVEPINQPSTRPPIRPLKWLEMLQPKKWEASLDESAVHSRIFALFPLLLVNGWKYTGFKMQRGKLDSMTVVLDFQKMVAGKMGGCAVPVPASDFHRDSFNLRDHIGHTLAKAESHLMNRRVMEMEGAA